MNEMQFAQVIPRLRVLETRLLDKAKFDRMIDASSAQEVLRVLQETEYANVMHNVKRAEDYEMILSGELKRVYQLIYNISPVKEVVDVMAIKYDYHNLKVLLKEKFLDKDFSNMIIHVGKVEVSKLKYAVDNEYYRDLEATMRKSIEEVVIDFTSNKDPQRIDIIFDKYMFEEMVQISKNIGDRFLEKYIESWIDLTNIRTLLRIKKQNKSREFFLSVIIKGGTIDKDKLLALLSDSVENIPGKLFYTNYAEILRVGIEAYSKNGSVNILEKLSDNYIMEFMKNAKYVSFGIEPLIAYTFAKESEIKIIRIIMVGKLNNIAGEVIRERLRDCYV
ncbi:ATP synthase subunit C [Clostridium polyendosporum]|uniref:ATP synthase subunit C n=1 Tax=Clostridium polyendosporum TaxID=69208 RepID=A0A919VGU4_9CLOT|nr:V-type ATP synthase subunit C [Clostridium polyendosporum]GIM29552.1 ATP synthase subunit C [Clostridium polyendosporum]